MTAQNLKMYNITTRQLPFSYATADSDSSFETSIDVDLRPTTVEIRHHRSNRLAEAMMKSLLISSQLKKLKTSNSSSSQFRSSSRRLYTAQCTSGYPSTRSLCHDISTDVSSIKARFLAGATVNITQIERKASRRIPLKEMRSLIRERADDVGRKVSWQITKGSGILIKVPYVK